ncbi:MAG: hypothetical protein EBR82_42530 [Caulobacteraceae bacterium]|nr:hypothetical protein [Caulobacteraceae bacterium]
MAVLAGRNADIYIATGSGTSMTGQATTSLGGGVYQITLSARRYINPNASLTVLDGVTTVNPANYQVAYGTGKIIMAGYTPSGAITVTGQFLTLSKFAQATDWTLDVQSVLEEVQVFGDAWKTRVCVQKEATVTFNRFYNDEFYLTNGASYFVIDCHALQSADVRWSFGASQSSMGISTSENETIKENVSFSVLGAVDYA